MVYDIRVDSRTSALLSGGKSGEGGVNSESVGRVVGCEYARLSSLKLKAC